MRVIVDTNIVFSAILNTDSAIAKILLKQKSNLNFYSVDFLFSEIEEHYEKLRKISGYSNFDKHLKGEMTILLVANNHSRNANSYTKKKILCGTLCNTLRNLVA